MTRRQLFTEAVANPLKLAKLIGPQSTYFDSYLKYEMDEVKKSRDKAIRVTRNFRTLADNYRITPELFRRGSATRISEREFNILTDPEALEKKEMQGGPDDIHPWDLFCIIEDWKIVLLAAMFSTLCHGITTRDILEGHNVPYLMEQCAKDCPVENCPIPKRALAA